MEATEPKAEKQGLEELMEVRRRSARNAVLLDNCALFHRGLLSSPPAPTPVPTSQSLKQENRELLARHKQELEGQLLSAIKQVRSEVVPLPKPPRRGRKKRAATGAQPRMPELMPRARQDDAARFGAGLNSLLSLSLEEAGVSDTGQPASSSAQHEGAPPRSSQRGAVVARARQQQQQARARTSQLAAQRRVFQLSPLARSAQPVRRPRRQGSGQQFAADVRADQAPATEGDQGGSSEYDYSSEGSGVQDGEDFSEEDWSGSDMDGGGDGDGDGDGGSGRRGLLLATASSGGGGGGMHHPLIEDAADADDVEVDGPMDEKTKLLLAKSRRLIEGNVSSARHYRGVHPEQQVHQHAPPPVQPRLAHQAVASASGDDDAEEGSEGAGVTAEDGGAADGGSEAGTAADEDVVSGEAFSGGAGGATESAPPPQREGQHQEMPHALGEHEWENEVARNIVSLYSTTLHQDTAGAAGTAGAPGAPGAAGAQAAAPSTTAAAGKRGAKDRRRGRARDRGTGAATPVELPALPAKKQPAVGVSWEASHVEGNTVVVNVPPVSHQIWFSGSGNVAAVWDSLARPDDPEVPVPNSTLTQPKLCAELQALESSRKYMKYVAVVEALVLARVRAYGAGDLEKRLWVQAIVTCNAFGVRSVEEKKFGTAMELLKKAQQMTDHHEVRRPAASPVSRAR